MSRDPVEFWETVWIDTRNSPQKKCHRRWEWRMHHPDNVTWFEVCFVLVPPSAVHEDGSHCVFAMAIMAVLLTWLRWFLCGWDFFRSFVRCCYCCFFFTKSLTRISRGAKSFYEKRIKTKKKENLPFCILMEIFHCQQIFIPLHSSNHCPSYLMKSPTTWHNSVTIMGIFK